MREPAAQEQRLVWSLVLAACIVFIGGLLPFVLGGSSSRIGGVIAPFTVGAIGLAACALLHNQSRTVVAIIYFAAGLAIIYGLLTMFSVPVGLAALGSCPVAPEPCATGLPRAMSDGENSGLGSAAAFGVAGLMVGYIGLVAVYRRRVPPAFTPPVFSEAAPELPAPVELPELPAHESNAAST